MLDGIAIDLVIYGADEDDFRCAHHDQDGEDTSRNKTR